MRPVALVRLALLALVALPPLGCSRQPVAPPPSPPKKADAQSIGIVLASGEGAWPAQLKDDLDTALAKYPRVQTQITTAPNAGLQEEYLSQLRMAHARAIILEPKDPQASAETVAKCMDEGTPVIMLGTPVAGDRYTCLIAADATQIGAAAGEWLAGRLKGKGNLVELRGPADSSWAEDLHKAWRAALRDPGYHFIFDGRVDPPKVDGGKLMSEVLGRFQKIDAVFAYDDAAALAAYQAAKAAGREKGIVFMGVGGLPNEGAKYVAEGLLTVSFLRPTGGTEAVEAAMKLFRGEQPLKKIVPPTRAIVKETPH
jgi:ribose transport system substrate-binding protein